MLPWDEYEVSVGVTSAPLRLEELEHHGRVLESAELAIVDVGTHHDVAVETSAALSARFPRLPLVGLFCCAHAVDATFLARLVEAGTTSVLDLRLSPSEMATALYRVAHGEHIVSLRSFNELWSDLIRGDDDPKPELSEIDIILLDRLRLGMNDREMAGEVNFSPHTVKHRIEQLRTRLGGRNRIELAALVGRYGTFSDEQGTLLGIETARLARGTAPLPH